MSKNRLMGLVALVLAVSMVLAFAPSAKAAPLRQESSRTITVTGFGTAYGAPDLVTVGLGVESGNSDIQVAMDETNQRMNAVMAALVENGVAREDIRTEHFSIYQDYGYGPMGPEAQQNERTYRVSTSVTVTVREVDNVSQLLAAAVDAGANMVNYIQFDIENRGELQATARSRAVDNAQARAADLAGLLGLAVGEPLEIVENADMYGPMYGGGGGGGMGMADSVPPISEGQLSVNMSVTITFALVATQ